MDITLSGQLSLSMLCEKLCNIPNSTMLMLNTDGGEIKILRKDEELFYNICQEWEDLTKLTLEYVNYDKMIVGDVNNYISLTDNGKIKQKGRFEVNKVVGNEPAYHKDNSFKIVKIALQNYFINNIPVEETIKNHTNIYDFCGRQKFKRDSCGKVHYIKNNLEVIELQQKNVRYYISTPGVVFMKYYNKGTVEAINKGYEVTIFNKYIDEDIYKYNINFQFYIKECYKEIEMIENKQLQLL